MKNDQRTGFERASAYKHVVSNALAKCMRKDRSYINAHDEAALDELCNNFESYMAVSMTIVD